VKCPRGAAAVMVLMPAFYATVFLTGRRRHISQSQKTCLFEKAVMRRASAEGCICLFLAPFRKEMAVFIWH